ncbi:MAG: hypothetical protein H6Q90_2304, partial [Deltaproteobacteria bacterium]|nr:hypothetical protein [Deltaproteobacteria bacterium]
ELYAAAPIVLDRSSHLQARIENTAKLLCDRLGPRKALVRLILSESGSVPVAVEARRRAYEMLATLLAARLRTYADRHQMDVPDPAALAWAVLGALEIQVVRWAVWNEFDLETLREQLRSAAFAVLPRMEPG